MKKILEFLYPKIWIIKVYRGNWYDSSSYILSYNITPFRLKKIKLKYLVTLRKEAFKECPVTYTIEEYDRLSKEPRLLQSYDYNVDFNQLSEEELKLYDNWKNNRDEYLENPKVVIYKEKLKL